MYLILFPQNIWVTWDLLAAAKFVPLTINVLPIKNYDSKKK